MTMLTINETYARHKKEYPDSQLSRNIIRKAVLREELKTIKSGNKMLINWDVFCKWLGYENLFIDKLLDNYEKRDGLTEKEKDILIKLLIDKIND